MKIFTPEQLYEADKLTIKKQRISSEDLMERASENIFEWLHERLQGAPVNIQLFCGIGNNGGDGIALARHLWEHGYHIQVHVVNYSDKRSKDFLINMERLKDRKIWPDFINEGSSFPEIGPDDIVVDAIFGIGLNRPASGWVGQLIEHINSSEAFKLSIDIPSGLFADKSTPGNSEVVCANFVLSIQVPKLVFFLPGTSRYIEDWDLIDIGLDPDYLMETDTQYSLYDRTVARKHHRNRDKYSHKGHYGHSLIVGGSHGKVGAVALASLSCIRAGSGLVTALVPKCGYVPMQAALPEIMVATGTADTRLTSIDLPVEASALGIGMGLGTHKETKDALSKFLENYDGPLVLDADALNILSANKKLLKKLPPGTILTPHPGELERMLGKWKDDFDKLDKAMAFAKTYKCILVIKGAHTITLYNGKGYINTTGNPGMATAGSGDVLTGIITALVAGGMEPAQAACFGVYLHGRAGDLASEKTGQESLIASDITANIGAAYLDLLPKPIVPDSDEETQKEN